MQALFRPLPLTLVPVMCVLLTLSACEKGREAPAPQQAAPDTGESAPMPAPTTKGEKPIVVASVGPYDISLMDLLKVSKTAEDRAKAVGDATVEEVRRLTRKRRLDEIIRKRLLVLGARAHPEWVTDASVTAKVKEQIKALGPAEVDRRRELAEVSEEDFVAKFTQFIREKMMFDAITRHEVTENIVITEGELKEHFDQNYETFFNRPDSWSVYQIERYAPRDDPQRLGEVMEELERIRSQVSHAIQDSATPEAKAQAMKPFVHKYNESEGGGQHFSYIYDTPAVNFDPELMSRLRSATVGELSPVFRLAGDEDRVGGCFFLAFKKVLGVHSKFEDVRKTIYGILYEKREKVLVDQMYERLRSEYPVTLHEDRLYHGIEAVDEPGS